MAWTRIDDKFLMNPKVQSAGVYGMALYLSGLIYCNTNLTDGHIPEVMLPALCGLAYQTPSKKVADVLVDLNLWERVEGGYLVHDFLSLNKSKTEIETLNKMRADNGAKGGRKPNRFAKQNGKQNGKQNETDLLTETEPINPNTLIPLYPNTQIKESTTGTAAVFSAYESEIGTLTGTVRDSIFLAIEEYSEDWIIAAIQESTLNNKRNWKYCEAILKRWKVEGFKSNNKRRNNTKPKEAVHNPDKFRELYLLSQTGKSETKQEVIEKEAK